MRKTSPVHSTTPASGPAVFQPANVKINAIVETNSKKLTSPTDTDGQPTTGDEAQNEAQVVPESSLTRKFSFNIR